MGMRTARWACRLSAISALGGRWQAQSTEGLQAEGLFRRLQTTRARHHWLVGGSSAKRLVSRWRNRPG